MSEGRKAEMVRLLEESGKGFRAALTGLSEEQARLRKGPDCWSVLEIVEHVAIVENGMFGLLAKATPVEVSQENPGKEALIRERIANRTVRVTAPERTRPTGRFENINEAVNHFAAARQETIQFVRDTDVDFYRVTAAHPAFGSVNGYELLLLMAGHPGRHSDQIAEIKSSLI